MKIYDLPTFSGSSTLEFLTMLALNTGRLPKASPISSPPFSLLQNWNTLSFSQGGTPDILAAARQVLIDWNHQKIPFFSEPPALHAAQLPSTISGSSGQVAPGAESTGHAQIVNAFGAPFMLEGLSGEADAEAMDADPDSEPAADNIGMDIEDDAGPGPAPRGMVDDEDTMRAPSQPPPVFPTVKQ
jgi:nuclear GTP-binding protein